MNTSTFRSTVTLLAVAMFGSAGAAMAAAAADDVVTIDQASATRGKVTPGDLPGFPVTISAPGTYRLTSNLTVGDANTSAIEINTANVTLDLNGFTISGPNVCAPNGNGVSCTLNGTGMGVMGGNSVPNLPEGIVITNGMIRGMGNAAIGLNPSNAFARVSNVIAMRNGGPGIVVSAASIVSNCIVALNNYDGIVAGAGSLVLNNTVSMNNGFGLRLFGVGSAYAGNSMLSNGGGSIDGGIKMGENACGAALCP